MENLILEDNFKVVELVSYGGELKMTERKFRELEQDEVLVKVMCSTIHPADISFLRGTYGNQKPLTPLIPGFEGSGLIVKIAQNVDSSLLGKRVGLSGRVEKNGTYSGLWAQYTYANYKTLMVFNKEIPYETIAFSIGNPLTAVGFLDTVRKNGLTSLGQNGASSSFGRILTRLCKKEGIKTVNLVRKDAYIQPLIDMGADYVINTSNPTWEEELKKLCKENNIKNFFECVGGDYTGKILSCLPDNSTLYHFGNLELKRLGQINTSDFIFFGKKIVGWWLTAWVLNNNPDDNNKARKYIVDDLESGSDLFTTNVSNSYKFDEYQKAFEYYFTNMSEGKVIIRPNEQ
jgi:NADPH2:quinone reductase